MITEKTTTPETEEKQESGYEWGIIIEYDGKRNILFFEGTYKEYPIGGVLCECMRLHPTTIRDVIREMGDLRIEATDDNIVEAAYTLSKHFYDIYPPATASMLAMQFYEGIGEWGRARKENRLDECKGLFSGEIGGEIFEYIFEDTPYDNVGDDTVEQIILSIYLDFAKCFVTAKYTFMKLFELEETKKEPEEGGFSSRDENAQAGKDGQSLENESSLFTSLLKEQTQNVDATFEQMTPVDTKTSQEIMDQILDYMKIQLKPEMDQLEMQLHPASLGTLKIHLVSKGGEVTAQFQVQNETVKAAVESQIALLKDSLKEQGIKVEAVEVTVESHAFESNLWQGQERENGSSYQGNKKSPRRINLNALEEGFEEEASDEELLSAQMMKANGGTVDFTA